MLVSELISAFVVGGFIITAGYTTEFRTELEVSRSYESGILTMKSLYVYGRVRVFDVSMRVGDLLLCIEVNKSYDSVSHLIDEFNNWSNSLPELKDPYGVHLLKHKGRYFEVTKVIWGKN